MSYGVYPVALSVGGLFGHVNHELKFSRGARASVIAGPNGTGKTHMLRVLRAALAVDLNELFALPFESARLTLNNDLEFQFTRVQEGKLETMSIRCYGPRSTLRGEVTVSSEVFDPLAAQEMFPAWLHQAGEDLWIDDRTERLYTARDIERRLGLRVPDLNARAEVISTNPWLGALSKVPDPVFIDTKRLDTMPYAREDDGYSSRDRSRRGGTAARISQYIDVVRTQIIAAKSESLSASQSADERFAFNLMNMAHQSVKQDLIERDYARLAALNADLSGNGLSGKPIDVALNERMNPTEKRVLNLFLQDWEKKLAPLLPVHDKLTTLKRIINDKFLYNEMKVTTDGNIVFSSRADASPVPVSQLSSGEQHLLALFTQLLFAASPGSTVLIDEPEISLHAAWKHSFVSDIEDVATLSDLLIVMATHSTAVINGRWEIVSELGVLQP